MMGTGRMKSKLHAYLEEEKGRQVK